MRGVQYLADGHHVDDAGNLISCTYVDLRDPAERTPIRTLQKASPKRYAIPDCETIRLSKPTGFGGRGEGLTMDPEAGTAAGATGDADRAIDASVLPLKFDAEFLAVQDRGDAIDYSPRCRPNCVMCLRDGTLVSRLSSSMQNSSPFRTAKAPWMLTRM